jgi:hypothetical protein
MPAAVEAHKSCQVGVFLSGTVRLCVCFWGWYVACCKQAAGKREFFVVQLLLQRSFAWLAGLCMHDSVLGINTTCVVLLRVETLMKMQQC